jgi:hypothetical protein
MATLDEAGYLIFLNEWVVKNERHLCPGFLVGGTDRAGRRGHDRTFTKATVLAVAWADKRRAAGICISR